MRIAIYARYSPRPEEDKSLSNVNQLGMVMDWLKKHGLDKADWAHFEDRAKSRDDLNRPGLWDAVAYCQDGVFVAFSLDRIGDIIAIETVVRMLGKQGAQLATVVEGLQEFDPDATLLRILRGGLALHQKQKNATLTSYHMRQRMANGEKMGRWPPFGWKEVYSHSLPNGKRVMKWVKCNWETAIRNAAIDLYVNHGVSTKNMRKILVERGFKTCRGRPLDARIIHLALKDHLPKKGDGRKAVRELLRRGN